MKKLRVLKMENLRSLTSVEGLTNLAELEELEMLGSNVADLWSLGTLTKLKRLSLSGSSVATTDCDFITRLAALEEVRLCIPLDSVAMCAGLAKLKRLRVRHSIAMVHSFRSLSRAQDIDITFW